MHWDFTLCPLIESLEQRNLLAGSNAYIQQDLVSDGALVPAARIDAKLVNPWGVALHARGIQVANTDSNSTTGYDASGRPVGPAVTVPGHPTGVVHNAEPNQFLVNTPSGPKPAKFIYVTEEGTVAAWSTANGNRAVSVVVDHSSNGSVYKGASLAKFKTGTFLYVANFALGKIEVYNSSFKPVRLPGTFADPKLPRNYAPFNVQTIGGKLWVAYAKRKADGSEAEGAGTGLINVFNPNGTLARRFTTGGRLNAPWGIAKAPANFAAFSNSILVGNFGDGRISAFNASTGKFQGQLALYTGQPIVIDGLWAIAFGNGKGGTIKNGLYFTAGPYDESHGLYGRVLVDLNYTTA
jgi:uncharacterized protein (TIGR03118 family)